MSRVRHLFAALGFCAGASLLPAEDYEMRLSKRVEEKQRAIEAIFEEGEETFVSTNATMVSDIRPCTM